MATTLPFDLSNTRSYFRIPLQVKLITVGLVGIAIAVLVVLLSLNEIDKSVDQIASVMASNVATSIATQIEFDASLSVQEKIGQTSVAQRMIDYVSQTEKRDAELLDTNLTIIADADHADIGSKLVEPVAVENVRGTLTDGKERSFVEIDADTQVLMKQVVVAVHDNATKTVKGALVFEYTPIFDSVKDTAVALKKHLLYSVLPIALLLVLATLWLANRVVRQVRELKSATMSLSEGQFKRSSGHYSNDELGDLTRAFDYMVDNMDLSEKALLHEIEQRQKAQAEILAINETLEERVKTRTAELTETNEKLDDELEERRAIERQLMQLACYDPLTGLPNRSFFLQTLEQAFERTRMSGQIMGLVFVDMDRFKSINDSFGHEIGDKVLQEVAQRFRRLLPPSDTASRIGGDEFTIIMENVDSREALAARAQTLIDAFREPIFVDTTELHITLSLGIAVYPSDSADLGELMKKADFAMYQAKSAGRNGYQFHSIQMNDAAKNRLAIEYAMRHALENNEFRLHYQVRVSASTNRPVGMEALLRWNSPTLGAISPLDFIPVAEETGMILELGDWVLRTACLQYAEWKKEGLYPGILGINVSARQFKQTNFVQQVNQIVTECGVDPHYIELEVTESMLMSDPERATRQMNDLRVHGFGIAIDDFGTGFNGLSNLKNFPATKIKIDRAFINTIDQRVEDAAIATAIVTLANSLNMQVTAEGVETRSQMAKLKKLACNEYQGFFFSEPLPAQSMAQILSRGLRIKGSEKLAGGSIDETIELRKVS